VLGCSERYLYQVFVRDIGQAPKRWMRAERMDMAARLLSAGRSIDEVTAAAGFSSKSGLRREYRAYFGDVPAAPPR
jgi:AraC-like DNA-binding protein